MSQAVKEYVSRTPEGGWRIAGTRVSLDSIVQLYWEGCGPEGMVAEFPSLTLEQIHGAIAFYLGRRQEMDEYLAGQKRLWEQLRGESRDKTPALLERLRALREHPVARDAK